MARVEIASQSWGVIQDTLGNSQGGQTVTIKNTDATNATHWSAITGGTSSTGTIVTNSDGTIPRYIESGTYDVTVQGVTRRVEVVDGPTGQQVVNVRSAPYSAIGNGTTDDTTAVQAAVTAAAGGTCFFPEGTYLVTTAITVPADTTIRGAGWGSILKVGGPAHTSGSVNGFTSTSTSRVMIESLKIIGPEDGTMTTANGVDFGKGIFFDTVTDYVIRDVHVSRFNIQGIYVGVGVRGRITGCTVMEMYSGNGISLDGLSIDNVISGNTLKDIADDGIGLHNGSARSIVSNNTITNTNFGRGVDVYGAPDTIVMGNTMRDIGGVGAAGRGIYLSIGVGSTVPHRCVIVGNSIYNADDQGILVDAGAVQIDDTLISSNYIRGSGDQGIYLAGKVNRCSIVGNQIVDGAANGIYAEHSGANIPTKIFIDGNQINGNGSYGIQATSLTTDVQLGRNDLNGNATQAVNMPIPSATSSGTMALPRHSGIVSVTGTTNISTITLSAVGEVLTLQFTASLTILTGGNIALQGPLSVASGDTLTLISDGSATWQVVSHTVSRGVRLPVRAGSTANVTLTAPGATIDGVTMAAGDRMLLKDQTTASQNGIYIWNGAASTATRATDANTAGKLTDTLQVTVDEGTINRDSIFALTTNKPITLETTALRFTRVHPATTVSSHPIGSAYQPTNSKLENLPRDTVGLTNQATLATGTIRVFPMGILRAGDTLTNINLQVGTTASAGITNSWAGVARLSDRVILAISATSTATTAANTKKTFPFAASFTAEKDEVLVGFVMYQATTVPSLFGIVHGNVSIISEPPVVNGISNTGQTTPLTVGTALTAFTADTEMIYAFCE